MANTQIDIAANGTTTLATAGKYCDRNIDVNVNVPSEEEPTAFTNVLKHEGCTVTLNATQALGNTVNTSNGSISVLLDLVALGITTHPTTLNLRWRGMDLSAYTAIYLSTDKSTWSTWAHLYTDETWDEHGDRLFSRSINYPTSNRYLRFNLVVKHNSQSVTQEDVDKCILTINEPIGNGGYVG